MISKPSSIQNAHTAGDKSSRRLDTRLRYYKFLLSIRPTQLGSVAKALLRVKRRVVKSSIGVSYWADPVSVFGFELLSQGCFERDLTNVVQKLLRPSDVFVDVGGNEGYFSILAARQVRNGRVICVEPQRRLIPVIQRNTALNATTQAVSIQNVALSNQSGQAQLYLRPSSNTGASSFYRHWKLGFARQSVTTKRFDDLMSELHISAIRLVKVDCEGAELLVLSGATDILQRQLVNFWVVDYHDKITSLEACERTHKLFCNAGYRLAKHKDLCIYFTAAQRADLTAVGGYRFADSWRE